MKYSTMYSTLLTNEPIVDKLINVSCSQNIFNGKTFFSFVNDIFQHLFCVLSDINSKLNDFYAILC